jgi:predicted HicB family RNase H-like nuclease
MQTKLTLRLDDRLIEQAKAYAQEKGRSLSQVVADYFRILNTDTTHTKRTPPHNSISSRTA